MRKPRVHAARWNINAHTRVSEMSTPLKQKAFCKRMLFSIESGYRWMTFQSEVESIPVSRLISLTTFWSLLPFQGLTCNAETSTNVVFNAVLGFVF